MRAPVASVLITAWNREQLVGRAIKSALASTIEDIEVLVVDDASTDGTVAAAKSVAAEDPRVRVIVNESNLGDYPNRNRAAAEAAGRYLKYLDSDDVIYAHGLAVMVDCMEQFPEAGLGLCAVAEPNVPYPRFLSPADAFREHFFTRGILGRAPGSAIIRRDAFHAVGGFSGRRQVGDSELWLKLASRFPIVKMPADLVWDGEGPSQEKHRDSEVEKSVLIAEIHRTALDASDCPLAAEERAAAKVSLDESNANHVWRLFRNGASLRELKRYQEKAGVPPAAIVAAGWNRLRAVAGRRRPVR